MLAMEGQPERDDEVNEGQRVFEERRSFAKHEGLVIPAGIEVDVDLGIARAYTNALVGPKSFLHEALEMGLTDPTDTAQKVELEKLAGEYRSMQESSDEEPVDALRVLSYEEYFAQLLTNPEKIMEDTPYEASQKVRGSYAYIVSESDTSKVAKINTLGRDLQVALDNLDISQAQELVDRIEEEIDRDISRGDSAKAA